MSRERGMHSQWTAKKEIFYESDRLECDLYNMKTKITDVAKLEITVGIGYKHKLVRH